MDIKIMQILQDINYRWIDDDTYIYSATEVLDKKEGNCWEQVELERELFYQYGITVTSYYVALSDDKGKFQTHTFIVYKKGHSYFWFEHAWELYTGIHEYASLQDLLLDVKEKLIKDFSSTSEVFMYEYEKPKKKMKSIEFLLYCQSQKLIKLNSPLYFYHLVDKSADLSKGLFSLKYFYDNKMYDLFDKYAYKYKYRIVGAWNIDKFHGMKESDLSREDIIEALETFRGPFGASYIYFFRYPPYKGLGNRMDEILKSKDIYRLNINDEEVMLMIDDIFYNFDISNRDNKLLNKSYYENVSLEEYFSKYSDQDEMVFANLNHIAVSFTNDFCPSKFLEKC
ncbi:MAG: hypothetical protein OSJ65_03000 [Bacilli bacterium]|nr:hypothetical protein [Bacilli bacterium]